MQVPKILAYVVYKELTLLTGAVCNYLEPSVACKVNCSCKIASSLQIPGRLSELKETG